MFKGVNNDLTFLLRHLVEFRCSGKNCKAEMLVNLPELQFLASMLRSHCCPRAMAFLCKGACLLISACLNVRHPRCLVPMIVVNIARVYLAALYMQDKQHYRAIVSMRTTLCLAKACLLVLIWRSCHEERAFIFKMITKLAAVMLPCLRQFVLGFFNRGRRRMSLNNIRAPLLFPTHQPSRRFFISACERLRSHLGTPYDPAFQVAIGHMTFVVMLGCALLGMKGIACLPGGRYVLQFFLCPSDALQVQS